jgi:hypothetical protein
MRFAAVLLLSCWASFAQIPTPESVLGHEPGDDFYLANYDESLAYFRKLEQATGKLKLVQVGKTSRGLDWYVALISSPDNLANISKYTDIARRLALVRGLTDSQARELAREGKVIVHIDGGLHSTEVAGAQHTIQLAYNLVTGTDEQTAAILDNVILVLWFSINPDGQNQVVSWYRSNLGTAYEVSPLPGLYQEYIGHDNNRDGYMNNMVESQVITRAALQYYPEVFYNHHQTAPFPARIWIPPFGDPVSLNPHPLMYRWVNVFGTAMAAYLDEHEMPGAMHRGRFDDWYPGFVDHVNNFRNTVSFLTETALYRYATPHFYTVDEFPKAQQDLHSEMFYASPWRGGWWRLGDAVRYMMGASTSVLITAARNREDLLYGRYRAGRDVMTHFAKDPPYAYVIPRNQRDRGTAETLVGKLLLDGIEVHQATEPFQVSGVSGQPGDWVVLMDQPFAALVKELFDIQKYPISADTPSQLPYDVTGWTLPLQMGVEAATVGEPVSNAIRDTLRAVDSVAPAEGKVEGAGPVFAFSHDSNAALRAVNEILAKSGKVTWSKTDDTIDATGDIAAILTRDGIDARSLKEVPAASWNVKQPRVGLYESWIGNADEGWTRWILEQFHFPYTRLHNAEIRAGHLRDHYDVLVLADASPRQIFEGMAEGSIPGQYAGGIGDPGAEALRDFVSAGGTLVALGNSTLFAVDQFDLAVTNVAAGLKPTEFFCSGALLRTEIRDPRHPLTTGLPEKPVVMFERNPIFDPKPGFKGKVLATYEKERTPLVSGYLVGADRIEGKAAALDAVYGKGHVVLLGFRPQWRAQSHGTYKFLFNALYYGPAMAAETPEPAKPADGRQSAWKKEAEAVKSDLVELLERNKAYFSARGPKAAEEGQALDSALEAFRRDRLPALDDLRTQADDRATGRKYADYATQAHKLAADLRTKDFSGSKPEDVLEQYRLAAVP